MIKAILFDFGGVVYEHPKDVISEVIGQIYNQPIEITKKEYSKFKNDYYIGKIPTAKLITNLSLAFKSDKSIEEVKKLWVKYYSSLARPNKDVLDIVKKLRKTYKVYLFSNTTEMSHLHNQKTGIYDNFDGLFMSYRMGMKKPDPIIFQKVITAIKCKPNECVFVDDSMENLEEARKIGIIPILFNVLIAPVSKLKEELKNLKII